MFTGIIERLGKVKKFLPKAGGAELFLDFSDFYDDIKLGESVAINGACLTVKTVDVRGVGFDVSSETLKKTTLGKLRKDEIVNIERALRVGDRLGGHFVAGHVDGIGTLREKKESADQCTISFLVEKEFTDMMIEKGSIAVDGVSLTIVGIVNGTFSVALIPYTLASTTLGFKKAGEQVNIEIDMMGKWIKKLLTRVQGKEEVITQEHLIAQGFL